MTFLSPDNGGTEGGVKTIEEPKGVFQKTQNENICLTYLNTESLCKPSVEPSLLELYRGAAKFRQKAKFVQTSAESNLLELCRVQPRFADRQIKLKFSFSIILLCAPDAVKCAKMNLIVVSTIWLE